MKKLLLAATIGVLVSCSNTYKQPSKNPAIVADVKNESRMLGMLTKEEFIVVEIDGKFVTYFPNVLVGKRTNRVFQGRHELDVLGSFTRGIKGPFEARALVRVDFLPGRTYRVNGAVHGAYIHFWVEDALTGKLVSAKVSARHAFGTSDFFAPPAYIPPVRIN